MLKRGSRTDPWVVHVRMRSSGGCARPRLLLIPAPPATPAKSRTPGYARRRDGPMTSERRSNCEFCRALGGVRLHVAAQFGRSRVGERWRAFLPAMTGRRPPARPPRLSEHVGHLESLLDQAGAGIVLDSRFRCWPPTPPRGAPRPTHLEHQTTVRHHPETKTGEKDRQLTGAAPEIEDVPHSEGPGQVDIDLEIGAVCVEGVVDPGPRPSRRIPRSAPRRQLRWLTAPDQPSSAAETRWRLTAPPDRSGLSRRSLTAPPCLDVGRPQACGGMPAATS
jgi:hypothetical protein